VTHKNTGAMLYMIYPQVANAENSHTKSHLMICGQSKDIMEKSSLNSVGCSIFGQL